MNYSANCQCGKVNINLALPHAIERYRPRVCDCEFCQQHRLSYISDKDGRLFIDSQVKLTPLKQGSEQAVFWQCPLCDDVVVVTAVLNGILKGAVNAQLFSWWLTLGSPIVVSPKRLPPGAKRDRWNASWLQVSFKSELPGS